MRRREWFCSAAAFFPALVAGESESPQLRVVLNRETPYESFGVLQNEKTVFRVGFGKNGIKPEGSTFEGGHSLLGRFRVNAILSETVFQMTETLVRQSGKSREWLADNLFSNMSSIDFDGDGEGGEYGSAFIGLAPIDSAAKQPFHFGEYQGVFRWYSYAIHGTQDESRIGKSITGGCINVGEKDLVMLVEQLKLGDLVEVTLPD